MKHFQKYFTEEERREAQLRAQREWRLANLDKARKYAREWQMSHRRAKGILPRPPKKKAVCHPERRHSGRGLCGACWEKTRRHKTERNRLKRLYGITPEQLAEMRAAQGGRCAICLEVPSGGRWQGKLQVDHDHATGKMRDLLCERCNLVLGHTGDSVELLRKLGDYLERHRGALAPVEQLRLVKENSV